MLLDTCAVVWLAVGQGLSERARSLISAHAGGLYVSAISAFEVGLLGQRGRLALPLPADAWFERAIAQHGLTEVPVTGAIAARSTMLPAIHGDPADRIIIATAQQLKLPVLTPDAHIRRYPDVRCDW